MMVLASHSKNLLSINIVYREHVFNIYYLSVKMPSLGFPKEAYLFARTGYKSNAL